MVALAPTATRVEENTAGPVNERIYRRTVESIESHRGASPLAIERRLVELDREWDIERAVEVEAPLVILVGMILGGTVDRRWLALPAFAASMLLVHNTEGWYPLLPILRRLGVRTRAEIDAERRELLRLAAERSARPAAGAIGP